MSQSYSQKGKKNTENMSAKQER